MILVKEWLLHGAIPDEEKLALDLGSPGMRNIRTNNQLSDREQRVRAKARARLSRRWRRAGPDLRAAGGASAPARTARRRRGRIPQQPVFVQLAGRMDAMTSPKLRDLDVQWRSPADSPAERDIHDD